MSARGEGKRHKPVDHLADGSRWSEWAALWQVISGRVRALAPGQGDGAHLARILDGGDREVIERVDYRLRAVAAAAQGREREAGRAGVTAHRRLEELGMGLGMLLRGLGTGKSNDACRQLDQQMLDRAAGVAEPVARPRVDRSRMTGMQGWWAQLDDMAGASSVIDAVDATRLIGGG